MNRVLDWAARNRKLLVAAAGFLATWAVQQWGADNPWVALAVGVAAAFGVWRAPNRHDPPPEETPPGPGRPPPPPLRTPHRHPGPRR
jgi:hypothetical protein